MKRALTNKILEGYPKPQRKVKLGDAIAKNLIAVLEPSGKIYWKWQGRIDKKVVEIHLGEFSDMNVTEARKAAVEVTEKRDLAKKMDEPFEVPRIRSRPVLVVSNPENAIAPSSIGPASVSLVHSSGGRTCQWLWDEYMRREGKNGKPRTVAEKQRCWDKDIARFIADKPFASITYDDLAEIIVDKAEESPGAASRLVSYIKRLFRWAVVEGRIYTKLEVDPAAHLKQPQKTNLRDRFLNEDEIRWFFKAMDGCEDTFSQCMTFTLYTGTRLRESTEMVWDEYTEKNGHWLIPGKRTKNGDPLLLPLPATMQELLAERKKVCGKGVYVFPATRADKPINSFTKPTNKLRARMIEIASQEAGKPVEIPNWTIHDLRRTLSTGMNGLRDENENALVPFEVVERVTNHRFGKVQRTYNHHDYMVEKRRALAHWADYLDRLRREALSA